MSPQEWRERDIDDLYVWLFYIAAGFLVYITLYSCGAFDGWV